MGANRRRLKGAGSVFYDKSKKRWILQQKIRNEETGKVKTTKKTLKATSKKLAKEKAEEWLSLSEIDSKEKYIKKVAEVRGVDTELISMEEAWHYYLNSANRQNPSEETLINNKRYWVKFKVWATNEGIDAVEKVTPQFASKYMSWLLKESSIKGQSYNKVKNFLKSFYATINHGTSRSNPFDSITNKEIEHSEKRDLTQEELEKILELADKDMKTLICIGAYTGLRLADATRLKWSEIDMLNKTISVIPQKTKRKNKRVDIPFIHSRLFERLEKIKLMSTENDYVLPQLVEVYNKNRSSLSRRFKSLCEKADIVTEIIVEHGKNISVVGFHSLRHSFVSECAKVDVPLFIVQEIVGL